MNCIVQYVYKEWLPCLVLGTARAAAKGKGWACRTHSWWSGEETVEL